MKVTLNWLKQYVDFDGSPEELAERLTMLGIEVEGIRKIGGEFEGVVVAQVLAKEKHPNADKLSLCRVHDGQGERQIVCGAHNFAAGDKVPLILPGHSLPPKAGEQPFTIKVGKIRGVESQGMMCSPKELGMAEDAEGLLILRPDARVGQPFAEYLGQAGSDVVYDLEITPNRPDLNSVIGIAREISAVTGNPLKLPELSVAPGPASSIGADQMGTVDKWIAVRLEDPELCPRYVARVLRGAKIGPSPDWLREALAKVDVRSINNVVDVTNYVMLETGQPLHAFDYHLLAKDPNRLDEPPVIVVRRADDGEKFTTLDGQERTLTGDMLLITDGIKPIALAGVMGGRNSEINERTNDVLLESACFKPQNIRATSRKLDLRTDASYRFERGADIGMCDWASRRAAGLILQTAGGELIPGAVDACPRPIPPREICLRHEKVFELLGVRVPVWQSVEFLRKLGLEILVENGDHFCTVRIPTFRVDLKRETDLIEEIARLFGVEKIPATPPRGVVGTNAYDAIHDQIAEARRILCGLGITEAQGQTLIGSAAAQLSGSPLVLLQNPLSAEMNGLRPSLLPGLLDALRHNLNRKVEDVALFEIGRVFSQADGQPREERHVALALTGRRNPLFWSGTERENKYDVFDLKGVVEEFLEHFGLRGVTYQRRENATALFAESASVCLGKHVLGEIGQLLPLLGRRYDLRDAAFLAELNLDLLLARRNTSKSFRFLPAFPAIRRDIAMLVAEQTTHEGVLGAVKQAKPPNLEAVELFDVFRGSNVPAGQKSVAYAFVYRSPERTLTDEEVNAAHEKLVNMLRNQLHAVIRE